MLNLHQLRIFYIVAKNLSFSRAAEELFISQPTVSVHIQKLEANLNLKLFDYLGKKVHLTETGQLLYTYAQKIFALADEAEMSLKELQGLKRGHVRIGASSTPGMYLLPKITAHFKESYVNIELSLQLANSHAVTELILNNQLDLGVVGEEISDGNDLVITPLVQDELVVIVAANHPFASRRKISPADLLTQEFILRERGSSTREVLEERLNSLQLKVKVAMELGSVEAIKQMVAANLGVSVVSGHAIELERKSGILHVLKVPELNLQRQINLVYHQDKNLSTSALAFIKWLKDSYPVKNKKSCSFGVTLF